MVLEKINQFTTSYSGQALDPYTELLHTFKDSLHSNDLQYEMKL
jgi:hypothetical protein